MKEHRVSRPCLKVCRESFCSLQVRSSLPERGRGDVVLPSEGDKPVKHKNGTMWLNSGPGDFLSLDNTEFKHRFENLTFAKSADEELESLYATQAS